MNLGGVMAQQVAAGKMQSALIVSPQIEFPGGVDTECVNGRPGNPQVETWLTRDVPDWVTHTFRVRTARSSWAVIGLSAGGWCAAMAAMLPAQYSAAIVLGGYFRPRVRALLRAVPAEQPAGPPIRPGRAGEASPPRWRCGSRPPTRTRSRTARAPRS